MKKTPSKATPPVPQIQTLKSPTCPTLSRKSTLTFELGQDPATAFHFRIVSCDGGGFFSPEWIAWTAIQAAIKKSVGPITSLCLRPLFTGTSVARVGSNAAKRTKRLALHNITESTLGALPIGGIAILLAGVAYELSQLCDGMKEIDELYTELEIEDEMDSSVMDFVRHPGLLGQDGEQLKQISE